MENIKEHIESTPLHHTHEEIQTDMARRAATEAMIQDGLANKRAAEQLRAAGYEISEDPRSPQEILDALLKSGAE